MLNTVRRARTSIGINGNMVYELPFGRGRMFGGNMPRVLDEAIGGWKMALRELPTRASR